MQPSQQDTLRLHGRCTFMQPFVMIPLSSLLLAVTAHFGRALVGAGGCQAGASGPPSVHADCMRGCLRCRCLAAHNSLCPHGCCYRCTGGGAAWQGPRQPDGIPPQRPRSGLPAAAATGAAGAGRQPAAAVQGSWHGGRPCLRGGAGRQNPPARLARAGRRVAKSNGRRRRRGRGLRRALLVRSSSLLWAIPGARARGAGRKGSRRKLLVPENKRAAARACAGARGRRTRRGRGRRETLQGQGGAGASR